MDLNFSSVLYMIYILKFGALWHFALILKAAKYITSADKVVIFLKIEKTRFFFSLEYGESKLKVTAWD